MATRRKEECEVPKCLDATQRKRLILIGKRDSLFSRLQDIFNYSLNALKDDSEKDLFLFGMISIDRLRSEFNEIVDELNDIELIIDPNFNVNFQSINSFEDMYCRCKFVYDKLNSFQKSSETADTHIINQRKIIRLPELELMIFSGDPIKWPIFYESFKRIIHENPDLTDHDRVQYLINKLSGRALSVCSGFVPNGDNYQAIWRTLVEKYDDKRSLAAAYLDQMFDFKCFTTANTKNLEMFLDKFCTAVSSLKSLKLDDLSDFIILQLALKKIDSNTARSFEMFKRGESMPTYNDFIKFIREQSKVLERTTPITSHARNNDKNVTLKTHSFAISYTTHCPLCKQTDHLHLYRCPAFNKLSVDERFSFIKQNKGCTNCLSVSHNNITCKSKFKCRHCDCKHHSMLCRKLMFSPDDRRHSLPSNVTRTTAMPPSTPTHTRAPLAPAAVCSPPRNPRALSPTGQAEQHSSYASAQQNVSLCNTQPLLISKRNTTCLLGTVQVYVNDSNNQRHIIRALVDSASQSNFITSKCCNKLNLKYNKVANTVVKGIGSKNNKVLGQTSTVLTSRFNDNFISLDAFIIDRITDNLPCVEVDTSCLSHLKDLPLADQSLCSPSEVDILIGAPLFSDIMLSGRITGPSGTPTAFDTIFGYILIGNAPIALNNCDPCHTRIRGSVPQDNSLANISLCSFVANPPLDSISQKVWQLEEVQYTPALSADAFENIRGFVDNVSHSSSGRYSVALPSSRVPVTAPGDSFTIAKKRFVKQS